MQAPFEFDLLSGVFVRSDNIRPHDTQERLMHGYRENLPPQLQPSKGSLLAYQRLNDAFWRTTTHLQSLHS